MRIWIDSNVHVRRTRLRSIQLARLLQGRALEVYQRLADSDVTSYEKLKEGLLKRFKLSERGYRSRFKKSWLENGETPEQFVERIRKHLRKWHEMANFEETYEGLDRERSVPLRMWQGGSQKSNLVRETQKTGTTSLCMLIDGTVKRFPTAVSYTHLTLPTILRV